MSSFLMGCYDPDSKKWCTVTKCSGGYDDAMLARLQKELDVVKISKVGEEWPTHTHTNKIVSNFPFPVCRTPAKSQSG